MFYRIQKLFTKILILSVFTFITPVNAADVLFEQKTPAVVNGEFIIELLISSKEEKINTLGGKISYPTEILKFTSADYSSSIINLWVDKPKVENNKIIFSGITPGGFQGEKGNLMTLYFQVIKKGSGEIGFDEAEAYLNDGQGTKTELKTSGYKFNTSETGRLPEKIIDETNPEKFEIVLGRSEYVFDNKWFVVFDAKDKQTGIDYYEIQETGKPLNDKNWKKAESPYLLSDQSLNSDIYVRATDKRGNRTVAFLKPSPVPAFYLKPLFWGILTLLSASVLILWLYIRRRNKK